MVCNIYEQKEYNVMRCLTIQTSTHELTMIRKSAWVPVNTGMSMGTRTVYGLFSRTPKLRSPLSSSRINTPMCIKPTRAAQTTRRSFFNPCWISMLSITIIVAWVKAYDLTAAEVKTNLDRVNSKMWFDTYTDQRERRSSNTELARVCPTRHYSSARKTWTSVETGHKINIENEV